jgi:hypothetical protein
MANSSAPRQRKKLPSHSTSHSRRRSTKAKEHKIKKEHSGRKLNSAKRELHSAKRLTHPLSEKGDGRSTKAKEHKIKKEHSGRKLNSAKRVPHSATRLKHLLSEEGGGHIVGTREEVYEGMRVRTKGGLTKQHLVENRHGKIVSLRKQKLFLQRPQLVARAKAVKKAAASFGALRPSFKEIQEKVKEMKESLA